MMVLGKGDVFFIVIAFFKGVVEFFVVDIGDAFKKQ